MAIENCNCGGNQLNRFYSLFTCNHSNCEECHWTNNKCCNGCYSDSSSNSSNSIFNSSSSHSAYSATLLSAILKAFI